MLRVLYTLLALGVAFVLFIMFALWLESRRARKKATLLLQDIDRKYADYLQRRLTLAAIEDKDIASELVDIQEQGMIILRPEIDGLVAYINATSSPFVTLTYRSPFFSNAVALVEELFAASRQNVSKVLSDDQIERLRGSFSSGIEADIASRILSYKTGEKFSF